jgi:hypothetical protein
MAKHFYVKYPLFLSDYIEIWISSLINIGPVKAELFHTDERTDGHKYNSRFSQFCECA